MSGACVLLLSHTVNEGTLALGQQWILGQVLEEAGGIFWVTSLTYGISFF